MSHTLLHNVNRKGVGLFSRVGLFLGDCSITGAYELLRKKEHQTSIPVSNHTLKMRLIKGCNLLMLKNFKVTTMTKIVKSLPAVTIATCWLHNKVGANMQLQCTL